MDNSPFELEALSNAKRYQAWVAAAVAPYLGRRILEVGAGLGNMSAWMPSDERLILTESDPGLLDALRKRLGSNDRVRVEALDLARDDLASFDGEAIDTVVSFNVLEHIEDDSAALGKLAALLRRSKAAGPKRLVTFVPAHQWAFGGMDKSFGHHRRYDVARVQMLHDQVASDAALEHRHMNVVGLLGWVWNGRIRGKAQIGMEAVRMFERLCPIIRPMDDLVRKVVPLPLGQSLLFTFTWR